LALWLIGLGIEMIWNDPGRPQQNGVVERSQGTAKRWGEPQTCRSLAELQRRLDADDRRQREAYPYGAGSTRQQAHPDLKHSGRPYSAAAERRRWDLHRVLEHLSLYVVTRRVDASGTISLWNRTHYVGLHYARQAVWLSLDPREIMWIIADEQGRQIRCKPAKELTAANIIALRVAGTK
jgi:hypothetical protein